MKWKKLRRTKYGIERVCHYHDKPNCYGCPHRAQCTSDIFERLAQYEDTGLPPEAVVEYRKFEDEIIASGSTLEEVIRFLRSKAKYSSLPDKM